MPILSFRVHVLACALLFPTLRRIPGTKPFSEPRRHALWQLLATSCIDRVDMKCLSNMSYKLKVSLKIHAYTNTHPWTSKSGPA